MFDVVVVGAGVFGVTAALELQQRGYKTCLMDPGPIPHPLAASTDISRVVRMEYGADELYTEMVEVCLPRWRDWNSELAEFSEPVGRLFHETGVTMFTRSEMTPGEFEFESYQVLVRRGHTPERLGADEITRRFPGWNPGVYVDGFFHALGGFAESGRVVSALVEKAQRSGVVTRAGSRVTSIQSVGKRKRVTGVLTSDGETLTCGRVVVAAGAWSPLLVPDLATVIRISGHPVFHIRPQDDRHFRIGPFATFMADIGRTGWYGFPVHPLEGVIKFANHALGLTLHPDEDRIVTREDETMLRRFLRETFPELLDAPIVYSRNCLYCDTLDEHFWIDAHPEISGLTVATGGSGHGFKFAPILGDLIADAVERVPNKWLPRFAWRSLAPDTEGEEAARFRG